MDLWIFDFDGVLADTFADMIQFAQEACRELGIDHTVVPRDLSDLEVMSFASFGHACGVPEDLIPEFVRICVGKFAGKKTPPPIFDGLPVVIRQLSARNILVVVTGNTAGNVHAFLAHHGLQDCFRAVWGVDTPGSKAEKIRVAERQFEVEDETGVFVGDSLSDIRAAKEAGIRSVAVGWGHQNLKLLIGGKPDIIVHSPPELLQLQNKNR